MATITEGKGKGKEPSAITDGEEEADDKKKKKENFFLEKEELDMYPKSQEGITWWPPVITKEEAALPMSDEFIRRKAVEYVVRCATIGIDMIDKYFLEKEMAKVSVLSDDDKDQTPSSPPSK